ncbi:MAG: hypothetical protein WD049_01550 [Candidatus Paceibacterota bacterium]
MTALSLASYRAMAIKCVIDFTKPDLSVVPHYSHLESTEKMNLSYWIGMAITAIAADEVLGVSRTFHASNGGQKLTKANQRSRSLADLCGQDTNNTWHIFEAKGRQTKPTPSAMNDWKAQASTVTHVNGSAIGTGSVGVARILKKMTFELLDPPSRPGKNGDIAINVADARGKYYQPFVDFLAGDATGIQRGGRSFLMRAMMFDPVDRDYIWYGLEDKAYEMHKSKWARDVRVEELEDESLYVGSDGVAVLTSNSPCEINGTEKSQKKAN